MREFVTGSPEELAAFAEQQSRMPALFARVFSDPLAPRTVVVVPGLSMDPDVLAKVRGARHYEERQLAMLMLLRLPNTRVVFVTSTPIEASIVDYYLDLLPGVPGAHARRRLTLLSVGDASEVSLTQKILERPRLIERIRTAIGDTELAHLSCFNVTSLERSLAVQLGIPLYGCDPRLLWLGGKSGSRAAFREAGIELPDGSEDLRDEQDLVAALASLKARRPDLEQAAVKLNDGFSGEGNAVFSFEGCDASCSDRWLRDRLPQALHFEARDMDWPLFQRKLEETGGIVEEWITGRDACSPSVQLRITPAGAIEIISTHDQVLGGPSRQVFMGCVFPAYEGYAREIQALALRVAAVLRGKGVLGRFGVDFMSVRTPQGWSHKAIEINLRKGGTTHTFQWLQFMTGGKYDPERVVFETPSGGQRCYVASDNLVDPGYRRISAEDLIDMAVLHGLHFDHTSQRGVVFSMIGAMAEHGKLGAVAIAEDRERARELFERTTAVLATAGG